MSIYQLISAKLPEKVITTGETVINGAVVEYIDDDSYEPGRTCVKYSEHIFYDITGQILARIENPADINNLSHKLVEQLPWFKAEAFRSQNYIPRYTFLDKNKMPLRVFNAGSCPVITFYNREKEG